MVEHEVDVCEGGQIGTQVCGLIVSTIERFFLVGLAKIEAACNQRRELLLGCWRTENPHANMSQYGLPNITYATGLAEASLPFCLFEPQKISICVWSTRVSNGNQGRAAAELQWVDSQGSHSRLHVYLGVLDRRRDGFHWKGFCMPLEDILVHELLHACGDVSWRGRIDGVIRHNIIGIEAVRPLFVNDLEEHMKIDLKAKKTEAEWQKTLDNFWTKATPRWFQWLGWVLILGTISFVAEETQSVTLNIVCGVSYLALFFYLQSLFYALQFHGFPLIKSEQARRVVSLTVSAILSFTVWLLLTNLVSEIQGKI